MLNLDFTIAVTQNFWDRYNFFCVWRDLAHPSNKHLYKRVRKRLEEANPKLLQIGDEAFSRPATDDVKFIPINPSN